MIIKFKAFRKVVRDDGFSRLGVLGGLLVHNGVCDGIVHLVFILVCGFVDGEHGFHQQRVHVVRGKLAALVDEHIAGVANKEVAVQPLAALWVFGQFRFEDKEVMLALHLHSLQVIGVELEANRVFHWVLVIAFVDDATGILYAGAAFIGEVAGTVYIAHFIRQDIDDVEIGISVSATTINALLVRGEIDGVDDFVAKGDAAVCRRF